MSGVGAGGSPALVDAAWLRDRLDDTVVLDASIERSEDADGHGVFGPGRSAFAARRIPGARLADLFEDFSAPDAPFPFTMPSVDRLEAAARAVGVGDGARVVVYDRNGGAWAARVWWLLRTHGHSDVSVLDGGLAAWEAAGHPVATGAPDAPRPAGALALTAPDPRTVTAVRSEVARVSRAEQPGVLVCGIRRSEFEGDPSRPGTGHIPRSASLPYRELIGDDGLIDLAVVHDRASALGLDRPGTDAIVYCGGGINAAGLALAFVAAGLPEPRLYDGSLTEWRSDPTRPLETGPGTPPA